MKPNKVKASPLILAAKIIFISDFCLWIVFKYVAKNDRWASVTNDILLFFFLLTAIRSFRYASRLDDRDEKDEHLD
jgi:hypothetical protein